jgi:hypothetical protein
MESLLALLLKQQDVGKLISLPPDNPSTNLPALLLASPANESSNPADVPPSEALDEKESDINNSIPNSICLGSANEDVSAPLFINTNCNLIPDNNPIANKPNSVANKPPSLPGNTSPLEFISNIEGYNYTTGGQFSFLLIINLHLTLLSINLHFFLFPYRPIGSTSSRALWLNGQLGWLLSILGKESRIAIAKSNSHLGKNV